MLMRNTKKFFQKTLHSVKSFLSGGYQRLPKSPPCNPGLPCGGGMDLKYSQSYRELDKVYTDFTNQWDIDAEKTNNSSCRRKDTSTTVSRFDDRVRDNLIKHSKASPPKNYHQVVTKGASKNRKNILYQGKRYKELPAVSKGVREERGFLVAKKLKELEMLDKTNVEHVLDIEEILHYYSRLTCPAYLDIVESFFMEMYSEILTGQAPSTRVNNNPWPQLQTIGF